MGYIKRLGGKNVAFLNYKKDKSVSFQGTDVDAMPVSMAQYILCLLYTSDAADE